MNAWRTLPSSPNWIKQHVIWATRPNSNVTHGSAPWRLRRGVLGAGLRSQARASASAGQPEEEHRLEASGPEPRSNVAPVPAPGGGVEGLTLSDSPSRASVDPHVSKPTPHRLQEKLLGIIKRFFKSLNNAWTRFAALLAFIVAIVSGVINLALVPLVNNTMLPEWQETACRLMQRKVQLGRFQGVNLAGVSGLVPLLRISATSLGPGPIERSSLVAPHGIALYMDPITSLVQQQLVLAVALDRPQVSVIQGDGFSWAGFPDDTTPSSRNPFPGLANDVTPPAPPRNEGNQEEGGSGTLPPVAVGKLIVKEGQLVTLVQSERVPRYWEHVNGTLTLGKDYKSLDLQIEADAHMRHTSALKCTVVTPTAKRHLRHVTKGADTPTPIMFGCDVLPKDLRAGLTFKHIAGSADYQRNHQHTSDEQPQHDSQNVVVNNTHTNINPDITATTAEEGPPATSEVDLDAASEDRPEAEVREGDAPATEPTTPSRPPVSIHKMIRTKRGRQAEAAAATGLPLQYSLTSYGALLDPGVIEVAERAEAAHLAALETGNPHVWPDAPWARTAAAAHGGREKEKAAGKGRAVEQQQGVSAVVPTSPQGGHVEVRLNAVHVNTPNMWPDMTVIIRANNLHAPLAERLLELPMDVHSGRLTGELRLRTYDQRSWQFPELYGRVQCHDVSLHFWDASDDILDCDMELVFERDRVYLHSARGWFGAVPLAVTGDLDLNPETGSYRLSASVLPAVEVNALRATLGVRPTPQPVAGAIRGVMHCTGPLEHPVFSGTAVAVRLPSEQLLRSEPTFALDALLGTPSAVAGFDKLPIMAATMVFTMDTTTQRFSLHSAQVVPVGGGQLSGHGSMWVAPEAESHPGAIDMVCEGTSINTGSILSSYLPPDVREQLPTGALASLGLAQLKGAMFGSHLAPHVTAQVALPPDSRLLVGASAEFSPAAISMAAMGPALSVDVTAHISTPHQAALKAADTQAEASHWARPRFEGVDLYTSITELDLLSMARHAAAPTLDPVSTGQPLRARCSGTVRCTLKPVEKPAAQQQAQQPQQSAGAAGRPRQPTHGGLMATHPSLMFAGQVQLSSMRINNLEVVKQVSGQLGVTGLGKVLCVARSAPPMQPLMGVTRPQPEQEVIEVEVSAPDLLPALNLDPNWVSQASSLASPQEVDEVVDSRCRIKRGGLLLEASSANSGKEYRVGLAGLQLDDLEAGSLRGVLSAAAMDANIEARQGRVSLALDSLRYASLAAERLSTSVRWEGDVVKLEETVVIQQGSRYEMDGEVFLPDLLATPTTNSQGEGPTENLPVPLPSSSRLTRGANTPGTTARSRASAPPPPSSTSTANTRPPFGLPEDNGTSRSDAADQSAHAGRWRLAVNVPHACLQDLLPATQLFSATQHPDRDYGAAKASFLTALSGAGQKAITPSGPGLPPSTSGADVMAATSGAAMVAAGPVPMGAEGTAGGAGGVAVPSVLPALQELSGSWSGKIQVYGDVQGASNVEFNLRGHDWKWGQWRLDRIAAIGTADTEEGVVLEDVSCASGPARASIKGALLGNRQDAALAVTNFPLAMLQPLYAALPPALQGVPPTTNPVSSGVLRPFASLSRRLETSLARLSTRLLGEPGQLLAAGLGPDQGDATAQGGAAGGAGVGDGMVSSPQGGPVSGLVFMNGWLGGSTTAPEATLDVKVDQGAVGATRLRQAVGSVTMDVNQRVVASVQLTPADMDGSVSLMGSLSGAPKPTLTTGTTPGETRVTSTSTMQHRDNSKQRDNTNKQWDGMSAGGSSGAAGASHVRDREVAMTLAVRDGGMGVLCALTPALQWQSGSTVLDVNVQGTLAEPHARGSVQMSNVTLTSPVLKHPVTGLKADVQFTGSHMVVNTLEAKVGRTGRISASGTLPLLPHTSSTDIPQAQPQPTKTDRTTLDAHVRALDSHELTLDMEGLELRVANMYSGNLDASIQVEGAVLSPTVGGTITFSRGTLNLQPPSTPTSAASTLPTSKPTSTTSGPPEPTTQPTNPLAAQDAALVRSAFSLLKAGRKRAALSAATGVLEGQGTNLGQGAGHVHSSRPSCQLAGLQVVLGPELRATFPVVLNVAVSGQVTLSGPADPLLLSPSGALVLDGGTLNLVATQFVLDREHTNRVLFLPEAGLLDPVLDIVLVSGDLRAVVAGRGSAWQDALSLTAAGTSLSTGGQPNPAGAGPGGTSGGAAGGGLAGRKTGERSTGGNAGANQLELTEVARVFEERLAEALLGENGQLALRSLASSTLHTLLPKLETRGQLGAARWRLVGAPALPNLLGVLDAASSSTALTSSSPDTLDPAKLLSRLAVGTELELMWGNSLTAALQHKLLSDSKIGTEARLTYRITEHLRLNLQLQGLTRPSLTLGYTSDLL